MTSQDEGDVFAKRSVLAPARDYESSCANSQYPLSIGTEYQVAMDHNDSARVHA